LFWRFHRFRSLPAAKARNRRAATIGASPHRHRPRPPLQKEAKRAPRPQHPSLFTQGQHAAPRRLFLPQELD
jgi:hypothetical protein